MKKVIITGGKIVGQVVLLYAMPDSEMAVYPELVMVDFREAVLTPNNKVWFMQRVPGRLEVGFNQLFEPLHVLVVDHEPDFDTDFWDVLDNKKNRERALAEWKKASRVVRAKVVFSIHGYLRHLGRSGQYKVSGENYFKKMYYNTNWDNV